MDTPGIGRFDDPMSVLVLAFGCADGSAKSHPQDARRIPRGHGSDGH